MSEKFNGKYRIESARLQNWDYANSGMYFITICTADRQHYFGEVVEGEMQLSEIGMIAKEEWLRTFQMREDMNLQMDEYVIMPNHFHLLVIPKHTIREDFPLDGEQYNLMPTLEFSEAMRRLLMGYSKSYNKFYDLAGSRFQQRSKAKHHKGGIRNGLDYLHENPTKAKLVDHPSEWGFSSYNEYSGLIDPSDCICDVALGRALLAL